MGNEVVSYVIFDTEDLTFHQGAGEWDENRISAVHYETAEAAQKDLEDCDQGELLRHRLTVVAEGVALSDPLTLAAVLSEVIRTRDAQDRQWGGVEHDDRNKPWDWLTYITKTMGKAVIYPPHTKPAVLVFRREMVHVAALAVAAIQSIDRHLERRAKEMA